MAGVKALELARTLAAAAVSGQVKSVLRGFRNVSYSQFGEDVVLVGQQPGRGPGFFVDVGAFHPTLYSNTFALYLRGWRGILIEPNPEFHGPIRRLRPRDSLLPCGVSRTPGRLKYFDYDVPAFNTFSQERADELEREGRRPKATSLIDTKPLHELLAGAGCPPRFDLLSVDCEGFDLEVLESNDWSAFRPETIIVEDHPLYQGAFGAGADGADRGRPIELKSDIHSFLASQDYALASIVSYSTVYRDRRAAAGAA